MAAATLSPPLSAALAYLQASGMVDARIDAVAGDWAYFWIPEIRVDATVFREPHRFGVWVRVPLQFPFANPHGVITKHEVVRLDGRPLKGAAGNHDFCAPVRQMGGTFYLSWTWSGELGSGPTLNAPEDVGKVVAWIERRFRTC